MVLTWLLTIAGVVLIFIEIGGWSAEDNPHAILGIITAIICFLQPIGALFRPAPTSSKRPIFNWLHWLGGNAAHICASEFTAKSLNCFPFNLNFNIYPLFYIFQLSQYSLLLN